MLKQAGCNLQIQLLTAKSIYEKAGLMIPFEIEADRKYFDTIHIARKTGIYVKSSGKPAEKAMKEIIRKLDLQKNEYIETWESKANWKGTVKKYASSVIEKVKNWLIENEFPNNIDYIQCNGQIKMYHVFYKECDMTNS